MGDLKGRIQVDSHILAGKPVIRGTRIAIELVIELLAEGWSADQILANYPNLQYDDLRACLAYASSMLKGERVYPLPA